MLSDAEHQVGEAKAQMPAMDITEGWQQYGPTRGADDEDAHDHRDPMIVNRLS